MGGCDGAPSPGRDPLALWHTLGWHGPHSPDRIQQEKTIWEASPPPSPAPSNAPSPPLPLASLSPPPLLKPSRGSWKVVDMVAMATEFRTGERRRRRKVVGWAREEGRRTSRHPNRAWNPPASPGPPSAPHHHLLLHPLNPTPGEDEEGYPQSQPKVGLSPEHPKGSPGATVPAQRCREPPVSHSPRRRHPPSGCLHGITQLLPSALIQGLNIPGPGIKIGTIWEGPESAASAAGTQRHPPRHAGGAPGPRGTWGDLPDLGTLTGRGSLKKAVCIQVSPLWLLEQTARPSGDALCPQGRVVSPRDADTDQRVTTAPMLSQGRSA